MKTPYKQQDLEQVSAIFDQLEADRQRQPMCPWCSALEGETPRHIPRGAGATCTHRWHRKNPPQFS